MSRMPIIKSYPDVSMPFKIVAPTSTGPTPTILFSFGAFMRRCCFFAKRRCMRRTGSKKGPYGKGLQGAFLF